MSSTYFDKFQVLIVLSFNLRVHLHSTVLHPELAVVEPDVLHVWIPLLGVPDPRHHLLGNHDFVVLLPSMCRGLSLVVAKLLDKWLYRRLPVHLLLSLFRNKTADSRCSEHVLVLWIHAHYGIPFLPSHRIDWLLCLLLVHPQNL